MIWILQWVFRTLLLAVGNITHPYPHRKPGDVPWLFTDYHNPIHNPIGYCKYLTNSIVKHTSDRNISGSSSVAMVDVVIVAMIEEVRP